MAVATEVDETSALESKLEDILLEYKEVESGGILGDFYDGSRAGKMLLDKKRNDVKRKLEKAYEGSKMDINKPMSIIDKSEEEVEDLLVLKNNKGTEDNRVRHMDLREQILFYRYQCYFQLVC